MLKISKLADYAIVIMQAIAAEREELFSASKLAERTHIAEPTVSKLLKTLTQKKLLQSQRGAQGGYSLAHLAEQINLAQIIAAIDGEIALTECDQKDSCCQVEKSCQVSKNWRQISSALRDVLTEISLAQMQQPITTDVIKVKFKEKLKR